MKKYGTIFNNPSVIIRDGVIVGVRIRETFLFVYGKDTHKTNPLVDKLTFKINLN